MEIKTSRKHRKCKYPLCKNILSIYNHESYCHIHLGRIFQEENDKENRHLPSLCEK